MCLIVISFYSINHATNKKRYIIMKIKHDTWIIKDNFAYKIYFFSIILIIAFFINTFF